MCPHPHRGKPLILIGIDIERGVLHRHRQHPCFQGWICLSPFPLPGKPKALPYFLRGRAALKLIKAFLKLGGYFRTKKTRISDTTMPIERVRHLEAVKIEFSKSGGWALLPNSGIPFFLVFHQSTIDVCRIGCSFIVILSSNLVFLLIFGFNTCQTQIKRRRSWSSSIQL